MIKIENTEVVGWEHAIHAMRNPHDSWSISDSGFCNGDYCDNCPCNNSSPECVSTYQGDFILGENDLTLANKLADGGPVHATYRRFINVYVDITAPLYFYKEMDRYRIGVEKISCSTMHTIHKKEFTLDDFSCEHLINSRSNPTLTPLTENDFFARNLLEAIICELNTCRRLFIKTKDKKYWWQMIQLLPSSYNQKRTYMFSYEALAAIYKWRKDHKLDEWKTLCGWIRQLPYSELITGGIK